MGVGLGGDGGGVGIGMERDGKLREEIDSPVSVVVVDAVAAVAAVAAVVPAGVIAVAVVVVAVVCVTVVAHHSSAKKKVRFAPEHGDRQGSKKKRRPRLTARPVLLTSVCQSSPEANCPVDSVYVARVEPAPECTDYHTETTSCETAGVMLRCGMLTAEAAESLCRTALGQ